MNLDTRTSIDTLLTTLKERLAQHGQSLLPLPGVMSRFTREEPSDEPGTLAAHSRTGFRVAYVFDIAQVDPLDGTPVESTPTPSDSGSTDGRRITCGLDQASHVEFATLAHETTHVLLHFPADRATRPDLTTRETEAEAVTYLLCAQLGIEGTDASVDYIRSYRGTPDTLDLSLERIRSTALRLTAELAAINFA